MLNQGPYGTGARWHLTAAIINNDVALAEWCLSHGANPNSPPPSDPRFLQFSLYESAIRIGRLEIAELLVRYGATRTAIVLDDMDAFISACMRLDRDAVRARLAAHPEYLRRPEPLFAAARADRADVAELLLDLGMSPDVENEQKERPLHIAGYENALRVAELLIARGAEIDPRESNWMNTPLAGAAHYQHRALMDLFSRYSRDVWELTYSGEVDRLREVLEEDPARGRVSWEGDTPLMWLPPHDEHVATEAARLLLASGADPTLRNKNGQTAADRAERMGMFGLAALLSAKA
jgi:ankyrin repeat protein